MNTNANRLNYHHLRYFWVITREKSLTRAAARLHVSQSALSVQLKHLEERLGHALFERGHRRLTLTEAGRLTFEHAEAIFRTGDELLDALAGREAGQRQRVRIGSVATLSRNFQLALLAPLLTREDIEWTLRTGTLRELMTQLEAHALDVVLSNVAVPGDGGRAVHSHLIARQPVSIVGRKSRGTKPLDYPGDLDGAAMILPGRGSDLRAAFDAELERANIRIRVMAEVDDMAMLRLLARESGALTLVPPVVVRDELASGKLVERCRVPRLKENFYAITLHRRFPNPLIKSLVAAAAPLGR
ncbi:MAG: LysR family transcriptional regulator [Betaproteobacteria bacterium]|nr:LysR family transcriptional regulator [Betaproteobacteria bacterium]